jgi:hypothetical protein
VELRGESGPLQHSAAVPSADDLICAVLRGESPSWPWPDVAGAAARFHSRCDLHGVNALLHTRLHSAPWPAGVLEVLRGKSVQLAMWELRHQQLLSEVLAKADHAGVQPVVLKGTALAYSLYADPAQRTRGDTDLLIPASARDAAESALTALGFQRGSGVSGELVSYQANYTKEADGNPHTIDLHWKINNSELLSKLFTYQELRSHAQPLHHLGANAFAPSPVYALLIACMHRSTHKENPYYVDGAAHLGGDRLIWLVDIELLCRALSGEEWRTLVALAREKGLRAVTLEGLEQARALLSSRHPDWVTSALAERGHREAPAEYLGGSKLRHQWMDFKALEGWPRRWRFTRELFFPSASYMRRKYPESTKSWMPWLYLRRAAEGLAKRLPRGNGH